MRYFFPTLIMILAMRMY